MIHAAQYGITLLRPARAGLALPIRVLCPMVRWVSRAHGARVASRSICAYGARLKET